MKKAGKIICYVFAGILLVLSLAFIVIEGRTLFSGDWTLFENQVNGFFRYFFRLLVAIFVFSSAFISYFALRAKASLALRIYFYFGAVGTFVSSLIISYFASNSMDLAFRLISACYFLGATLVFAGAYKEIKSASKKENAN